jgi:phage anti-repressor protein
MNTNMKEFLKKYTTINDNFIDELYSFYKMCEEKYFGIEINDVIKYLDIQNVDKFYEHFIKNYIQNIDYKKMINGQKYTYYYMNLETFERICMMSKAEKANKVRDYFIILRKFIQYYKNNIEDMIINNSLQLPEGTVYIILINKGKNIFKFGRTQNIRERLQRYATGKDTHPDIKFIMLVNNKDIVENCVKNLIKEYQYKPRQEIYKVNIDIIKNAIFDCALLNVKYEEFYNNENIDSYIIFDDSQINGVKKKTKKKTKKTNTKIKKNTKSKSKRNLKKSTKNYGNKK